MKTRNLFYLFMLSLCLMYWSCTQDQAQLSDSRASEADAIQWKPSDGIARFIPEEYKDNIRVEDLEFAERLLRNPKEEGLASRGAEIHIAAGSTNALAKAIAGAGWGDVIVLDPGDHFETGTVVLDKVVSITGCGATLIFSATPVSPILNYNPGIFVNSGADISTIRDITFKSTDTIPSIAIFLNGAKSIKILNNTFENWQFSIAANNCSYLTIMNNVITSNTSWQTGAIPFSQGIALADGSHNQVINNTISGAVFGIFTGGSQGVDLGNYTHHSVYGQILCKLTGGVVKVKDILINTSMSTSRWLVVFNKSENNFAAGYLVVDGASRNLLENNQSTANGTYDIELAGASLRFGYPTPTCFDNRVTAYPSQLVKDCGSGNIVYGGIHVDTSMDPCN